MKSMRCCACRCILAKPGRAFREVLQATVDCTALCEGERRSAKRVLVSHQCVCLCTGGQLAGT